MEVRRRPPRTPELGVDEDVQLGAEALVNVEKRDLVQMLRPLGDHDTADRADAALPDQVDTDRDADTLASVGLDRDELLAKPAAGGIAP